METYDRLVEKWAPVLNEESAGKIQDSHRRAVTAAILENQEQAFAKDASMLAEGPTNTNFSATGASHGVTGANWNPVLIALVRRAMPNLMAYELAGVQPMTGPTGLIFAMRSRYKTTRGGATADREALGIQEPLVPFSGDSAVANNMDSADVDGNRGPSGLAGVSDTSSPTDSSIVDSGDVYVPSGLGAQPYTEGYSPAMKTENAEKLGYADGSDFAEMGFTIEKATVTARSRALKAEYSLELAQDLKAIHGLDAETELANILSTEILAEINREIIRTINSQAKIGSRQAGIQTAGIFDLATDADGRWSVEKFKGLLVQLEREANVIAKETRRGKGNVIVCSSDVATALTAAGMLDYAPALSTSLNVDDTGNTFAGVLNGRIKYSSTHMRLLTT